VAVCRAGYNRLDAITGDHLPPGAADREHEWAKWFFLTPPGMRKVNLHIRQRGRANQRYPLLFRDYLRAQPAAAEAYARVKTALAHYHADDIDAYYAVKDPVCDLIIEAAEIWAQDTAWQPGPTDI